MIGYDNILATLQFCLFASRVVDFVLLEDYFLMHYYCSCLNITIDVLNHEDKSPNLISIDLIPFAQLSERWLECHVLSEQSIHVLWQSFIQSISIREMKLNRCLACNVYTHVTNNQSNRILINKDLLDENTVKQSYMDPNYSKITKIILFNGMKYNTSSNRLTSLPDEIFQREYELIQQLYRQSLEDADRRTEEKIRVYQHEQEELLQKQTEAINKELDTFLSLMRSMPRYSASIKTSPTLQTSISYLNENSMESGFGSDIFDTNGENFSRRSSVFGRTLSERSSNLDEDPMIDHLDWSNGNSNFATSLPQEIAFQPDSISHQNEDENDDLERIGKSFRELSQSLMCTDGTELFGDLPSPRLNTRQT